MSTVPPTSCRRKRARGTTSVVDAAPIREIRDDYRRGEGLMEAVLP